ncbi:MAG: hypothetical protein FJZ90_20025 [Chloroflexi bacterium]|nr:hypothetical protein [Chloroflexota bacterium]
MSDQDRLELLQRLDKGTLTVELVAGHLGKSQRHVYRLLAAVREQGARSIPHGNRGRSPAHALDPAAREQARELLRGEYAEFNNHHAQEMLADRHDLMLSVSTIRRLRRAEGLASPRKRRAPKHRSRRERKPQAGMMLQLDGSLHRWCGPEGAQFTLLAAIDDATGEVVAARFDEHETTVGYMRLLWQIIAGKGRPLSFYAGRPRTVSSTRHPPLSWRPKTVSRPPQPRPTAHREPRGPAADSTLSGGRFSSWRDGQCLGKGPQLKGPLPATQRARRAAIRPPAAEPAGPDYPGSGPSLAQVPLRQAGSHPT